MAEEDDFCRQKQPPRSRGQRSVSVGPESSWKHTGGDYLAPEFNKDSEATSMWWTLVITYQSSFSH